MQTLPSCALNGIVVFSAYALDLILGDPHWLPHPVRGMGWLIRRSESILRRFAKTPLAEKTAGVVLVLFVVSFVWILSHVLILFFFRLSIYAGFLLSVLLAFTTLAARSLGNSAHAVLKQLDAGDLDQARAELAMIVGRDTAALDDREIARAAIETVAENASDGVIAPLFFLAIGGPELALAYKAVNTLDSMVGYRNEQYINFGWAAARLDDVANYIPARITGVLICLVSDTFRGYKYAAAFITRNVSLNSALRQCPAFTSASASAGCTPHSGLHSPWRIMLRDRTNHPSPNSGYPEAAMAGALGIRLGGASTYAGHPSSKPYIGDALTLIDKKHIEISVQLMYCVSSFAVLGSAAILFLF